MGVVEEADAEAPVEDSKAREAEAGDEEEAMEEEMVAKGQIGP